MDRMAAPPGYNPASSLLPVATAPIHAMSGGGPLDNYNSQSTLLPAAPSIPIHRYEGGAKSSTVSSAIRRPTRIASSVPSTSSSASNSTMTLAPEAPTSRIRKPRMVSSVPEIQAEMVSSVPEIPVLQASAEVPVSRPVLPRKPRMVSAAREASAEVPVSRPVLPRKPRMVSAALEASAEVPVSRSILPRKPRMVSAALEASAEIPVSQASAEVPVSRPVLSRKPRMVSSVPISRIPPMAASTVINPSIEQASRVQPIGESDEKESEEYASDFETEPVYEQSDESQASEESESSTSNIESDEPESKEPESEEPESEEPESEEPESEEPESEEPESEEPESEEPESNESESEEPESNEEPLPAAPLPVAPLPAAPLPVAPLPVAPLPVAPLPVAPVEPSKSITRIKRPTFVGSKPSAYASVLDSELLELWDTTTDYNKRDEIIVAMKQRNLFPSEKMTQWEYETGAYPDTIDPEFLQKLLTKREFADSLQTSWIPNFDPCDENVHFEVTPVQRFVTNFMSPKTPYMSALLYHGVGVGKTCGAIQITEAWLEFYPNQEVYIVAPPTIQLGFFKTIFDIDRVALGVEGEPNTAAQCTGTTYMKLTNTLYERDKIKIDRAVQKFIRRRYKIMGYVAFANYITDITDAGIPQHVSEDDRLMFRKKNIRSHFSGRLLIVDEAHNLRDIAGTEQKSMEVAKEEEDSAAGKLLTPLLMDVLEYSEGMKFCALTATPMYNSYEEIIFMLNLLHLNDKKGLIRTPDVFDMDGNITKRGETILAASARRYVSFMRGENPRSFPIRLFPEDIPQLESYPIKNPRGVTVNEGEKKYFQKLPMVPVLLSGDTLRASVQFMNELAPGGEGLNTVMLEKLVHAGNFIVPATDSTRGDTTEMYTIRTDRDSLLTVFDREGSGSSIRYRAKPAVGARWLAEGALEAASPKFQFLLSRIRRTEGCIFVYSRFVNGGALPLALVLEANGYTPYHGKPLLADGIQAPGGKQCAGCYRKQQEHNGVKDHLFSPAYYGMLTGNSDISPNNEATILRQKAFDNKDGMQLKIIIGSQIASEGVDLRFIRETHILDSWFHLNKTEQIIGRSIRFLSHCKLPKEKRNTTIYLYAAVLPSDRESADLYSYRVGFKKAVLIGKVTRLMKQSAIDCNLNQQAIVIRGEPSVKQEDSQRKIRPTVNINDTPFTAICDWIETCDYTCKPQINVTTLPIDDSTYDEYSARWRMEQLKQFIRERFEDQPFYQSEDLWNLFASTKAPLITVTDILKEITNNKSFQVRHEGINGYIRFCNGYYIFQPNIYADLTIPLAIRVASFPVKRDQYLPMAYEHIEYVEEKHSSVVEKQSIASLWNAIVKWCTSLSAHTGFVPVPYEINQRRLEASHDNREILDMYQKILETIGAFYESFDKYNNAAAFRKVLLHYFWDEWLSVDEQKELAMLKLDGVSECIQENEHMFGTMIIRRWLNPKTGLIDMVCDGKECSASIIDQVNQSKSDKLRQLTLTKQNTGHLYGFIVPKDGEFVFKTNEQTDGGWISKRGKECINVSNKPQQREYLLRIGDELKTAHGSDCHLDRDTILESPKIKNSVRACTIMNLFLRFLDAEGLNRKRWFFRPVVAYYTNHRGMIRSDAKKK